MRRNHFAAVLTGLAAVALLAADASAMYHPTLGRFLQRDPIGYSDGMGVHEYSRSCPVTVVDPQGTLSFRGVEGAKSGTNPLGKPCTATGCDSAYWQIHLQLDPGDKAPGYVLARQTAEWDVKTCTGAGMDNRSLTQYQMMEFGADGLAAMNWRQEAATGEVINQYALQFYNENMGSGGRHMGDCTRGSLKVKVTMHYFSGGAPGDLGFYSGWKPGYFQDPKTAKPQGDRRWWQDRIPKIRDPGPWRSGIDWPGVDPPPGVYEPDPEGNDTTRAQGAFSAAGFSSQLKLEMVWKWDCCGRKELREVGCSGEPPAQEGLMAPRRTGPMTGP